MFEAVVYSLSDPITNRVRYIGKTAVGRNVDDIQIAIRKRVKDHLIAKCNTEKYKWVSELKTRGLLPIFNVIVYCHSDIAIYIERMETYNHINNGCDLFNIKIIKPLFKPNAILDELANGLIYWAVLPMD